MWDWLNLRRRFRRQAQSSHHNLSPQASHEHDEHLEASVNRFFSSSSGQPLRKLFFLQAHPILESPPKCLSRLPCSQMLYGERVEDFFSNCWLEDHLHRFGCPVNRSTESHDFHYPLLEENDGSETISSDDGNIYTGLVNIEDQSRHPTSYRQRLALEELFLSPGNTDSDLHAPMYDFSDEIYLPPYTEIYNDPPPCYEDVVLSDGRSTTGSRSSSILAIMW